MEASDTRNDGGLIGGHVHPRSRNKTLKSSSPELGRYADRLIRVDSETRFEHLMDGVINQDILTVLDALPRASVDLLFLDPPYNISKRFNSSSFAKRSEGEYAAWMRSWFDSLLRTLKPNGSVYICGDWQTSAAISAIASEKLIVRNRITWEREKGRGSARNWKNCSEDIWFCTVSDEYTFNANAVKLRRRVLAPYTDRNGLPKDWESSRDGNFRLTYPSNLWTDLTVPFWSMAENTDHPTQKPEKLLAKVILASSNPGDLVLDPFLGSGTTAVVAKKLNRRFIGVEIDEEYCLMALKRLEDASNDGRIQGYDGGAFWDRNAQPRGASNSSVGTVVGNGVPHPELPISNT